MENDAKLGMFAGVAAVIVIAVVYFQKPEATASDPVKVVATAGNATTPPNVPPAGMVVPSANSGSKQPTP